MSDTKIGEALDLLRERGWCKWILEDGGRMCMAGAVNLASHGNANYDYDARIWNRADYVAMSVVAREQYPERVTDDRGNEEFDFVDFNNHPDTTFEDVERVMEKANLRRLDEMVGER